MTDVYFASLLVSGGVCLGFALHSWTLLRRSSGRSHRLLLVLSLLEAAYCMTAYAYFRELDPARALHLVQAICIFTPSITYFFGELVMELTAHSDERPRWFCIYQRVNLALIVAFSLLVAFDGWSGAHLVTGLVATDLASRHRHRLTFPPLGEAWLMWVSVSFVLFSVLLYRGYRVRRHLLPIVLGCAVYFASTISDFGVLTNLYDAYFVQHFGFFALVTGCWWVLAGRYEASLGELREVVSGLEEQRRRLLISAPVVHQHKLDGIGALAAGVAHEINNPVQGIMNYTELLKKRVEDEVALWFVREILGECLKVSGIVRALLALSRNDH
ncbi:MAG: histidine kinase dimerization/phospho-acceptor domain-containing protein, partial [Polyangiaceae bacterium]